MTPRRALILSLLGIFFAIAPPTCWAKAEPQPDAPFYVDDAALSDLESTVFAYVASGQVANISYEVWQGDRLLDSNYFGRIRETDPSPVSEDTIHRIYSLTKPVTAIGLLVLMERGHFELDDPITKFLPEFEQHEILADHDSDGNMYTYRSLYAPTMAQLLSHTAGFSDPIEYGNFADRKLFETDVLLSTNTDDLVQRTALMPYEYPPGAFWNYSIASDLQGAIIERITGETLSDFLNREIFQPLNMVDTEFFVSESDLSRVSDVTVPGDAGPIYVVETDPRKPAQSQVYQEGGHGLFSTQRDIRRFVQMLQNDGQLGDQRIPSPETVLAIRTNAIKYRGGPGRQSSKGRAAGLGYGFGVRVLEDPLVADISAPRGTYYATSLLGSWFWVDPENDIICIGMVQTRVPLQPNIIRATTRAIYGDMHTHTD